MFSTSKNQAEPGINCVDKLYIYDIVQTELDTTNHGRQHGSQDAFTA